MKGYKGFDKDLKCRGMQFEVGKEFTTAGAPKACNNGLHFCENPIDIFGYYDPANARFAEVEARGETDKHHEDSKVATNKLFIKAEISLMSMIGFGVKFILDRVNWKDAKESNTGDRSAATNTGDRSAATNTGDRSAATNTGYRSAATNTGYRSAATNTGDRSAATNTGDRSAATNTGDRSAATNTGGQSAATVEGKESVAISIGIDGKAKGKKGCWIVLAEWEEIDWVWHRTTVKSFKIDGKRIKEDVFYTLKKGKIVKAK